MMSKPVWMTKREIAMIIPSLLLAVTMILLLVLMNQNSDLREQLDKPCEPVVQNVKPTD